MEGAFMKIRRRIWALLLSMTLIVTSTGVIAFADDTVETGINEQTTAVGSTEVTEEAEAEESAEAAEGSMLDDIEFETVELPAEAEEAITEAENAAAEGVATGSSSSAETAKAPAASTSNVLSYSAAGINSKVKKSLSNYRSILIAGIDNGGRADLIIVFSYNKKTKKAKVVTVSRDTYMQLNNSKKYTINGKKRDFCKCNQAAEYGGMNVLIKELNRHLDLNIREYIGVDWECTATLIDTLGGLEANVKNKSMLDGINVMLPADNKIKKTGTQKLNGWQTVQYLRVRHYYESDAARKKGEEAGPRAREDRNRDVFVKLFNMARGMKLSKVLSVYETIADQLVTNMDIPTALELVKDIKVSKTPAFPYSIIYRWDPDGYFIYYIMDTNASNVKTLHNKMFGQKSYKLSSTASSLNTKTQKLVKSYLTKEQTKLTKAKITVKGATYTGSPVSPTVKVKLGGRYFKEGVDYELKGSTSKTSVGTYTVTIKGLYPYDGQNKKVTYKIAPKGTGGLTLTAAKKGFTASWDEQAEQMSDKYITGYQLQYSTKKSFSGAKSVKVKGHANLSKTVKKLSSKKTYYVRVRTYMTVNKKTCYSAWSASKSVKTK